VKKRRKVEEKRGSGKMSLKQGETTTITITTITITTITITTRSRKVMLRKEERNNLGLRMERKNLEGRPDESRERKKV
jgi:hypothetical protein